MEKRYYELLEERTLAREEFNKIKKEKYHPNHLPIIERKIEADNAFRDFCEMALEQLMKENSEILKRLKNI